jgi:hypothetical protein
MQGMPAEQGDENNPYRNAARYQLGMRNMSDYGGYQPQSSVGFQ